MALGTLAWASSSTRSQRTTPLSGALLAWDPALELYGQWPEMTASPQFSKMSIQNWMFRFQPYLRRGSPCFSLDWSTLATRRHFTAFSAGSWLCICCHIYFHLVFIFFMLASTRPFNTDLGTWVGLVCLSILSPWCGVLSSLPSSAFLSINLLPQRICEQPPQSPGTNYWLRRLTVSSLYYCLIIMLTIGVGTMDLSSDLPSSASGLYGISSIYEVDSTALSLRFQPMMIRSLALNLLTRTQTRTRSTKRMIDHKRWNNLDARIFHWLSRTS